MRHHANTLVYYYTSEIGTTSLQGTKLLAPKCPLFGGSTSGTSDKEPSEIGTTSLQGHLLWHHANTLVYYFTSEIGTTSLQGTKLLAPKCPLFGDYINKILKKIVIGILQLFQSPKNRLEISQVS